MAQVDNDRVLLLSAFLRLGQFPSQLEVCLYYHRIRRLSNPLLTQGLVLLLRPVGDRFNHENDDGRPAREINDE